MIRHIEIYTYAVNRYFGKETETKKYNSTTYANARKLITNIDFILKDYIVDKEVRYQKVLKIIELLGA